MTVFFQLPTFYVEYVNQHLCECKYILHIEGYSKKYLYYLYMKTNLRKIGKIRFFINKTISKSIVNISINSSNISTNYITLFFKQNAKYSN